MDPTTRLIDRLERKGLCKRVRLNADRRVNKVELTREGQAAVSEMPVVLCRVMNEHLAGFSDKEWGLLKLYLQRMIDNGEAMRESDRVADHFGLPPGCLQEAPKVESTQTVKRCASDKFVRNNGRQ